MNTAFFASDPIALDAIQYLKDSKDFPLVCVVSNPDKPKGRGNKVTPNEVSQWALSNDVELLRPVTIDESVVSKLKELSVELIVVMAYGSILKDNILNYGKYPCLNLHGSILPKLRGASPIETSIAQGDTQTGLSLMSIVKRMDAGDVCDILKIDIDSADTAQSLRLKFRKASPILLDKNLESIRDFTAKFEKQDESQATYTRKFEKADMYINFNLKGFEICNQIRALGAGILKYNDDVIKVNNASYKVLENVQQVGKVICATSKDSLQVSCLDGVVRFDMLQKPCAKMMSSNDFFKGYEIIEGTLLESFEGKSLLK